MPGPEAPPLGDRGRRPRGLAISFGALAAWAWVAACESSGHEATPRVSRLLCSAVRCAPPDCCGRPCATSADCCAATVCSTAGLCIPEACELCGGRGCVVDEATCTAECAPAGCCTAVCSSDTDCCPGARCGSVGGEPRCVPLECSRCGAMRPVCQFDATCRVLCDAPPSCGAECATDTDCDARSRCSSRAGAVARCVPEAFEALCDECPAGCLLDARTCELVCTEPPGGCRACCEACDDAHPCCPGAHCDPAAPGAPTCVPDECGACAHGCVYSCPR